MEPPRKKAKEMLSKQTPTKQTPTERIVSTLLDGAIRHEGKVWCLKELRQKNTDVGATI